MAQSDESTAGKNTNWALVILVAACAGFGGGLIGALVTGVDVFINEDYGTGPILESPHNGNTPPADTD